jgi:protein-S-isoprenylcysteine O-methyltransferase Ste14
MKRKIRPIELLYKVATGSRRLRLILTPVGLIVFCGLLLLVVFGSLQTDKALGFSEMLSGPIVTICGVILLLLGLVFWIWCIVWFLRARGTPVPFNPPRELVTEGPYAWSRNPMLTGVFAFLFGMGLLLHSMSMAFIWTPVFVILNILELKLVEEPELEQRFGESYKKYRQRVPMFIPKFERYQS